LVRKQDWAKCIARGNTKKSIRNIKEIVEKGQRVENGFKGDEKKMLLDRDGHGYKVRYRAAEKCRLKALELFWFWDKEAGINPKEILLVQNKDG